jgi:acetyl esterase
MPFDQAIIALMPQLLATGGLDPNLPVAERRAQINKATDDVFDIAGLPGPEVESVVDHQVPVDGGTVLVRLYYPHAARLAPVHLYIHGGSFWQGTIESRYIDALCRERCAGASCVVATVEYRLAPEFPFPIPVEDCYAALAWLFANAGSLGIDATSVSIGGGSAGANLAAAVALLARDRGLPELTLQALEVPALDLTLGHLLDIPELGGKAAVAPLEAELGYYLPNRENRANPLASPLLADDLSGLPPAMILMAEYDFIRGDGEAFAAALDAAGVPALAHTFPGQVHVSASLTKAVPAARAWNAELVNMLRVAHGVRTTATVEQMRQVIEQINDADVDVEPVADVRDMTIPGPKGAVPVRVYRSTTEETSPVVMFFHGGGWIMGSPSAYDKFARRLVNRGRMVLVSVDYRLAPENPFPAGLEDCYAASTWAAEHAAEIGGEPGAVAVIGDSAGGNLAAAVALLARDRRGPKIVHQVLVYPGLDGSPMVVEGAPPAKRNNAGDLAHVKELYQPGGLEALAPDQAGYAWPLQARKLGLLPPATVVTAGWDALRSHGWDYARRLAESGVTVELLDYPTMYHGFLTMAGRYQKVGEVTALLASRLMKAFEQD